MKTVISLNYYKFSDSSKMPFGTILKVEKITNRGYSKNKRFNGSIDGKIHYNLYHDGFAENTAENRQKVKEIQKLINKAFPKYAEANAVMASLERMKKEDVNCPLKGHYCCQSLNHLPLPPLPTKENEDRMKKYYSIHKSINDLEDKIMDKRQEIKLKTLADLKDDE